MTKFLVTSITLSLLLNINFCLPENLHYQNLEIFEDKINKSVECVRSVLSRGLPQYHFPSFNPLEFKEVYLDLSKLPLPELSGFLHLKNGKCTGITAWKIINIEGEFVVFPPTYTVNFGMHYDKVTCGCDYEVNVTVLGVNIWGKGNFTNSLVNMDIAGHLKAEVNKQKVKLQEFSAPIKLGSFKFLISGLYNDKKFNDKVNFIMSFFVPKIINNTPNFFTKLISPILIAVYNALVNDDLGVGIVKTMTKKCIIDVIFPPK